MRSSSSQNRRANCKHEKEAAEQPCVKCNVEICGDLVKADAEAHKGVFRAERTGETVEFSVLPKGSVRYLNAESSLADLPLGTRCRFHLFQDEKGAFTKASLVADDYSHSASNAVSTSGWRITASAPSGACPLPRPSGRSGHDRSDRA